MELTALRYFVCVANYLSFSRAAEHLYISQSALSYHISNLEKELGTQLFVREKRRIYLTQAGQILLEEADHICRHVDAAYQRISRLASDSENTLRFAFLELLISTCFNRLVAPFLEEQQEIHGVIERCSNHSILDDLLVRNSYDFAFTRQFLCDLYGPAEHLTIRPVLHDSVSIIVPAHYPCAQWPTIDDLSPLSDCKLLMMDKSIAGGCYDPCFKLVLQAHGFYREQPDYIIRNMDDLMGQVAAGRGFSIVPFYQSIPQHYHGARLIRLVGDDVPNADIVLAWDNSNMTRQKLQFLSFVESHFELSGSSDKSAG